MSVTSDHVEETVTAYLGKRPAQRKYLAPLLDLLATGAELTGRQIPGHVTVSGHLGDAVWYNPAELVDASLLETVALMNGALS